MEMTLSELFALGGWAMWPLVVFSVATLALFFERTLILTMSDLSVGSLRTAILPLLSQQKINEARVVCDAAAARTLAVPVYRAALDAAGLGENRIERAIESAASRQIHTLERGLDLLLALGSIAPITGFLGTVSGMISAFNAIATAADVNAQLVAGGIFEALITTAFGLAIAIVAITGYNLFAHFIDRFATDLEEVGNEIVTTIVAS